MVPRKSPKFRIPRDPVNKSATLFRDTHTAGSLNSYSSRIVPVNALFSALRQDAPFYFSIDTADPNRKRRWKGPYSKLDDFLQEVGKLLKFNGGKNP